MTEQKFKSEIPIVTLTNGLRIGNFSSPHTFEFEDGSILESCSNERAEYLKIKFNERKIPQEVIRIDLDQEINHKVIINNIVLSFELTENVIEKINQIMYEFHNGTLEIDLIIIPLPMLTAMKDPSFIFSLTNTNIIDTPFRVIKMKSRIEKKVRIDDFCV